MLAQRGQSSPSPFADLALAWPSPGWGRSVTKVTKQAGPASVSTFRQEVTSAPALGVRWCLFHVLGEACKEAQGFGELDLRRQGDQGAAGLWEPGEEGAAGSCPVCQAMGTGPLCAILHGLAGLEQLFQSFPCQVPQSGTSLRVGQPHPGLQSCCGVTQLCVLTHTGDSCISSPFGGHLTVQLVWGCLSS